MKTSYRLRLEIIAREAAMNVVLNFGGQEAADLFQSEFERNAKECAVEYEADRESEANLLFPSIE